MAGDATSKGVHPRKVIRDPVHNLIPLEGAEGAMILALVDRPEFQRLRRIRQLGLGFLAYPGAEHSRWIHGLGVFHVARRMLDSLRGRPGDHMAEYSELRDLRRPILAAALLHDVGHGPFSHVFERAIPRAKDPPAGYPKDHEGWSMRIINECFASTLEEHGVDAKVVAGLISKTERKHLLAKDFISSQLDADRMDYLLRDSWATGPKYGYFDLEWLLRSLRIGMVATKGSEGEVPRLCFDSRKAIHVIEEYIQAREFMYQQVYVHRTTRAFEALLTNIVRLAVAICDGSPSNAPSPCPEPLAKMLACEPVNVAEYLHLDDYRLWSMLADWTRHENAPDESLKRLGCMCRKLVNREKPYKAIELDPRRMIGAAQLEERVRQTGGLGRYSCALDTFEDLAYRNALYRESREDEEQEDRVIHVLDQNQRAHPAESMSELIQALSTIKTTICRLYYDADDLDLVKELVEDGWVTV